MQRPVAPSTQLGRGKGKGAARQSVAQTAVPLGIPAPPPPPGRSGEHPGLTAANPGFSEGAHLSVKKSAPQLGKSIAAMQTCLDSLSRIPAIASLPGELGGLQQVLRQTIVVAKDTITQAKPLNTRLANTKAFVQRKQVRLEQILGEIAERQKQVDVLRQVISLNSGILDSLQQQLQQQEVQESVAHVCDPVMQRLLEDLEGVQAPELGPALARFKTALLRRGGGERPRPGDSSDEEMLSELPDMLDNPSGSEDSEDQRPLAQLVQPRRAVNMEQAEALYALANL